MATYNGLQTEVRTLIIDLPTAVSNLVPTYVNRAIREATVKHNFEVMKATTAVLITAPDTRVLTAVPSLFKEYRGMPYMLNADGSTTFLQIGKDRASVEADLLTDEGGEAPEDVVVGSPKIILRGEPALETGASDWEVWPLSDTLSLYAGVTSPGEYRVRIPYWKHTTALSASGDTNWFTVNAEEYIVFMATSYGFFADWDAEKGTYWKQMAGSKLQELVASDKRLAVSQTENLVPQPEMFGSRHQNARGMRRMGTFLPR